MEVNAVKNRIHNDPDYIDCPRFKNSVEYATKKFPEGLEDKQIAKVLMMTKNNVQRFYDSAIRKIRKKLKID